ncbi:hypothetical protein GYMLUDRAFT_46277 [Collybiopsis luxurians FD-317 M1]|uniref:V-SNARE coiled-coil homology domain-containing protein n=1 Tax=Collybiopsis luxurians FD-317 M1 TaxID=944289 RepID=A0A0D0BQJ5_9AGAR|nr:hypothetical protein GYMLUDRAFT_46277 [Collybiopsis luxurians FD-317 M1]
MRDNISKVAERGERLDSLQDKTGELNHLTALWCFIFRLRCERNRFQSRQQGGDCALTPILFLDNLAVSAQGFRRGANRVRKNMWYVIHSMSAG